METKQVGRPAVRYGLIFGVALAVVGIAVSVLTQMTGLFATTAPTSGGVPTFNYAMLGPALLIGCVGFLLRLGLSFLAGMFAAKQTGKTVTGAVAGLIAGLVSGIVGVVFGGIVEFSQINQISPITTSTGLSSGTVRSLAIGGAIFGFIFALALNAGIGAGMGALGGLVGKERSPLAPSLVPVGYPGYPGYPPYPGYPGYPPTGAQPGAQPGMWPQGMPPAGQPWPTGAPPSAPMQPVPPMTPSTPEPTFSPPPPEHHGH